jgi:uncharacterized protein YceK
MKKERRPTTLVGIRQLLLRIAVMVALVGLGGVLVKTGAVAQTTNTAYEGALGGLGLDIPESVTLNALNLYCLML